MSVWSDDMDADRDDRFFYQLSTADQISYLKAYLGMWLTLGPERAWSRWPGHLQMMIALSLVLIAAALYYGVLVAFFAASRTSLLAAATAIGVVVLGTIAVCLAWLGEIFDQKADDERRDDLLALLHVISERDQQRQR